MIHNLAILKNYHGIDNFLVFLTTKEIFINNAFVNVRKIIFAMGGNNVDTYEEIDPKKKNYLLIEKHNINSFIIEHSIEISKIKKEIDNLNETYSWLQILQIFQVHKTTQNSILESKKIIDNLYSDIMK